MSYKTSLACFLNLINNLTTKSTAKIVIGNHDSVEDGTPGLEQEYLKASNLSKPYYSFDHPNSNVHFLVMSTQLNDSDKNQLSFVNNDLDEISNAPNFTIVMMHKPLYTSPSKHPPEIGFRNVYAPLFQKNGVDLVVQAHNHIFEVLAPNGNESKSLYVTVGTGGRSHYPMFGKLPFSLAPDNNNFGFLGLTLNGTTLNAAFYRNTGEITSNFTRPS